MTTDKELFNLCKEVYERTGWDDTAMDAISSEGDVWDKDAAWLYSNNYAPLYTSDDLLEKLPKTLKHHEHYDYLTLWSDSETDWNAVYELSNDCDKYHGIGDTPLKALLKLTIALSEAGELTKLEAEL